MIDALEFKPDFAPARERWEAFWQHELVDRPVCVITAPREGVAPVPGSPYTAEAHGNLGPVIERILASAAATWWGGEAMPYHSPSFGADQLAAWLGGDLVFPQGGHGNSWVNPVVEDWEDWLPLRLDPDNYWWRRMLDFCRALAEAAAGKMLVAHVDLHSNLDTLLALRGGMRLSMDLMDCPETIDRAMQSVRRLYAPIYDAIHQAGRMEAGGTLNWLPAYHPVRAHTIACDYAALIGPDHFRRWVLPALEEEAAYLGHCGYHLDGPEQLVHLEDILAIPQVEYIQWVPIFERTPMIEWLDLLERIQQAGVAVWVPCDPQSLPLFHRRLRPELVFYQCHAETQVAGEATLQWLAENT